MIRCHDRLLLRFPVLSTRVHVEGDTPRVCYALATFLPVPSPTLLLTSPSALSLIQSSSSNISNILPFFSGGESSYTAWAHCYTGHQFGSFSGQLGDGASCSYGHVELDDNSIMELNFKGSGPTVYARGGDGRKVLRSSVREMLAAEHLHALSIPSTRVATLVVSETETVPRDSHYTGNIKNEPVAVISRLAPTFWRFGSFGLFHPVDEQTHRSGPSATMDDPRSMLLDMIRTVTENFFPEIEPSDPPMTLFTTITQKTATLVAKWQVLGFCHGVLNTDNMSVLGLTLDYGPFGWMEHYQPTYVCNASDTTGRYAYNAQIAMCRWNLETLASKYWTGLLPEQEVVQALRDYDTTVVSSMHTLVCEKMGLVDSPAQTEVVAAFWKTLEKTGGDLTLSFRHLSQVSSSSAINGNTATLPTALFVQHSASLLQMSKMSAPHSNNGILSQIEAMLVGKNEAQMNDMLNQLGNHFGASGDYLRDQLRLGKETAVWKNTTCEQFQDMQTEAWETFLTLYQERLREDAIDENDATRMTKMNLKNPIMVLRNHVAQTAITYAENRQLEKLETLFHALIHPYDDDPQIPTSLKEPLPDTMEPISVTCSS